MAPAKRTLVSCSPANAIFISVSNGVFSCVWLVRSCLARCCWSLWHWRLLLQQSYLRVDLFYPSLICSRNLDKIFNFLSFLSSEVLSVSCLEAGDVRMWRWAVDPSNTKALMCRVCSLHTSFCVDTFALSRTVDTTAGRLLSFANFLLPVVSSPTFDHTKSLVVSFCMLLLL